MPVYSSKRRSSILAEIDLLAQNEDCLDVYEVKCSFRITKARKQLTRIKKLMPEVNRLFFFCGSSGVITQIDSPGRS
ncbi:MAG TPA: hypothetical protein VJC39_05710 [Candidatus Nanoarchaeia archaeon]|nr:hypothetical protein [Candidatus Nanoarchaeia archaeon]